MCIRDRVRLESEERAEVRWNRLAEVYGNERYPKREFWYTLRDLLDQGEWKCHRGHSPLLDAATLRSMHGTGGE